MHEDIRAFVETASRAVDVLEPIVEVGSYQVPGQEGLADLRSLFPDKQYIGCDIVSGAGVDRIEDFHKLSFADESVGTLIAVETLEHVMDPYLAVREIHRVLRPRGVAIITAPFNFPIHHMPDYTRFTPEGLARLLGGFVAQAVFAQGDAQNPHTVCAIALKSAVESDHIAFESVALRLQNAWNIGTLHDPLIRFEPIVSAVRWDRPERNLGVLTQGRTVEQGFRCPRDGLTRVDFRLTLLGDRSGGDLRLEILDEHGTVLQAVETPARYVWHERWVAFQFPALTGTAQRHLRLRLHWRGPTASVTMLASQNDGLTDAELVVDGAAQRGTVCFEAFCARPDGAARVPEHRTEPLPVSDPSVALVAARLQAAELRHTTALLHADVEHLRRELASVSTRLDAVGGSVVNEFASVLRRYWPLRIFFRAGRRERGTDKPRRS
jgi:hypothetical protein